VDTIWGPWQAAIYPSFTATNASAGPAVCVGETSTASFAFTPGCGKKTRTDLNHCTSEVQTQSWCFSSTSVSWVAKNSGGTTVASGSGSSASFVAPGAGTYTVTFTVHGSASDPNYTGDADASATVIVYGITISPSSFTTCIGASNTFTASGSPPGASYSWNPSGDVSGGGTVNRLVFTSANPAEMVTVTYGPGCTATATGLVDGVTIRPASIWQACSSNTLTASGSPAGGTYQWRDANGNPIGTDDTLTLTGTGTNIVSVGYTVTANGRTTSCSAASTGVVYRINISQPTGDPSKTNQANAYNQRIYSSDNPGVLTVPCLASSPGGDPEKLRWRIDNIGSIVGKWSPHADGDETTGKGDSSTATFSNLPSVNGAFGQKTITLSYVGLECSTQTTIQVYFAKTATNHPGGVSGTPNWYFYWSQTSANKANTTMVYSNGLDRSFYDYFNGRKIVLGNGAAGTQISAWGTPKGVDTFAWVTAHEAKHHTQSTGFWPINWDGTQDTDSDWLPNNQEATYMPGRPYVTNNPTTYPDTIGYGVDPIPDAEDIDMRSQTAPYNLDQLWTNGSANGEDWANPGKNSYPAY